MKRQSEAGVTLLEILVAVTLLSLLSAGVLVAMRLGFNTMEKTDERLVHNRRVTTARKVLENEIAGFVYAQAYFSQGPQSVISVMFLEAEQSSMRFVTAYSLEHAWRGGQHIAALQVVAAENGQGVRLILNEVPYTGPLQAGRMIAALGQGQDGTPVTTFAPILAGAGSFIVADHLAFCRFSYLGRIPEAPFQVWRSRWAATNTLPLGVRIEMAPLDSTPNDLRVTTVTAPFHVNLTPGIKYADQP